MNILMISGSPRKNGNTARILERICAELPWANTEICYLPNLQLNGCLGCSHCQQVLQDIGCVQQDAVQELLRKIIAADMVIYGTPLYGHSYSGQLKLVLDRHTALFKFVSGAEQAVDQMEIYSLIAGKPVALVVSCQGPTDHNTELIQMQFDRFCESSLVHGLGKYIF
ncbi:MAG: flavodoxin family protein, partial [Butyricicoccus sp.]